MHTCVQRVARAKLRSAAHGLADDDSVGEIELRFWPVLGTEPETEEMSDVEDVPADQTYSLDSKVRVVLESLR